MKFNRDEFLHILKRFFEINIIAVCVVILCYVFLAETPQVTGDSMDPTLKDKETILAEKVSIKYKKPQRGEVLIFKHPENERVILIKRVVGLPGESFMINEGKVFINGAELNETYTNEPESTNEREMLKQGINYLIPEGYYVMLGDNRAKSLDSREWGFLNESNIVGRAVMVYKPAQNMRFIQHKFDFIPTDYVPIVQQ